MNDEASVYNKLIQESTRYVKGYYKKLNDSIWVSSKGDLIPDEEMKIMIQRVNKYTTAETKFIIKDISKIEFDEEVMKEYGNIEIAIAGFNNQAKILRRLTGVTND